MRITQLIEGPDGRLSGSSLSLLIGVIVMSIVVLVDATNLRSDVGILTVYVGLCSGSFLLNKQINAGVQKAEIDAKKKPAPVADNITAENVTVTGPVNGSAGGAA